MLSKLSSCHSDGDTSSSSSSHRPQSQTLNVSAYFTEHLIAEFLYCIPVKTLLRFRCVSKQWCSLIDSPRFVKTHLKRSIECNTNTGLIIRGCNFNSVDFDSLDNSTAVEIDEPLKTCLYGSSVVGSCNGLLCLFNPKSYIFLWNPATRKCRKLPTAPTDFVRPFGFGGSSLCGFGYDAVNDDYKVMKILQTDRHDVAGSKVIVYSLKTNSWKRLQNVSCQFQYFGVWGTFMGGALHWITIKTLGLASFPSIFAVDLGVENYREVPMPKVQNKNVNDLGIVTFDDSLCILEYHHHIRIDVWVMNDYGVEDSWCKLFTVQQPKVIRSFVSVRPIAYSKSRKDVLLEVDNKKVMWYNLERKKVKTVKIAKIPDMFDLEVYTESLVQPDYNLSCSGKQLQKHPPEKKKQQEQQKRNERDKFLAKGFKLVL